MACTKDLERIERMPLEGSELKPPAQRRPVGPLDFRSSVLLDSDFGRITLR